MTTSKYFKEHNLQKIQYFVILQRSEKANRHVSYNFN